MSTATLERVALTDTAWGDWRAGEDGLGERKFFVYRESIDGPLLQRHMSAKGTLLKYTVAGAEKKARELNREIADAKRRDAFLAKREAERQELQVMAQEVRKVARCGTLNSEMIARWIIGNFTHNDEVHELREIADDAQIEEQTARDYATDAETRLEAVQKRCNGLAEEARILLATLGAFGAPAFSNPLEFASGNTDLEKVIDMSRDLIAALEAYEQES